LLCSIGVWITDDHIKVISDLEKLEKLNLYRSLLTDNALQYIRGLKEMTFWDCKNITTPGLEKLIEFSPKLQLLEVRRCNNIDKACIYRIAKATCNGRSNVRLKTLVE